jgi:hypothetical protein
MLINNTPSLCHVGLSNLPLFVYNIMYDKFQPLLGLHHVNNFYTTLEITARCTFVLYNALIM